jgi:chemotaxis protein CheD
MAPECRSMIVGGADCQVSRDNQASLVTYALGSCIGIAIYDPLARVGGMLHFMLPESSLDPEKARLNPYMFADTGVPLLFRRAYGEGADKRRLVVRVAGGAQVIEGGGMFNIGKRNYLAVRKLLWKAGVLIHAEAVGGNESRTIKLEIGSGRMLLRTAAGREEVMEKSACPIQC